MRSLEGVKPCYLVIKSDRSCKGALWTGYLGKARAEKTWLSLPAGLNKGVRWIGLEIAVLPMTFKFGRGNHR